MQKICRDARQCVFKVQRGKNQPSKSPADFADKRRTKCKKYVEAHGSASLKNNAVKTNRYNLPQISRKAQNEMQKICRGARQCVFKVQRGKNQPSKSPADLAESAENKLVLITIPGWVGN
jgi:hypothetical protein